MARLHTLSNGARLVCDPIAGFETLALSVVVGRGARWESKNQSGWAHLLEHMTFKGAGGRSSRQIVEAIEAEGGHINAATGYERTSFQIRALRDSLNLALDVTSGLMFRPDLDAEELEREKAVVAQEIAEAADTPDDRVFDLAQTAAYGETSLGRPILGTEATVNAATALALAAFHQQLYSPDRVVISVAGAVDEDAFLAQAEGWFGAYAPAPTLLEPLTPSFVGEAVMMTERLEQAHLVFMLPAGGARDEDYFPLRLFAEALGGGMSSRLFQEAREKRGLAYNIDAYAETYADTGVLGVYAGCSAKKAEETAKVAAAQILALTQAPEDAELSRAKAQLKGSLFMARESAASRAEQAAGHVMLFDRLLTPAELAAGIDAVTTADLKRVGARALSLAKSSRVVLGPAAASGAAEVFHETLFA